MWEWADVVQAILSLKPASLHLFLAEESLIGGGTHLSFAGSLLCMVKRKGCRCTSCAMQYYYLCPGAHGHELEDANYPTERLSETIGGLVYESTRAEIFARPHPLLNWPHPFESKSPNTILQRCRVNYFSSRVSGQPRIKRLATQGSQLWTSFRCKRVVCNELHCTRLKPTCFCTFFCRRELACQSIIM